MAHKIMLNCINVKILIDFGDLSMIAKEHTSRETMLIL